LIVRIASLLCLLLLVSACNNQQLYHSVQKHNESRCRALPLAQQQDCMDELRGPDYDKYRRELDKL